jgi:hypothetical protein
MAPKLKLNRRLCKDCAHVAPATNGAADKLTCTKSDGNDCQTMRTLDFVHGTPRCGSAGMWWEPKR